MILWVSLCVIVFIMCRELKKTYKKFWISTANLLTTTWIVCKLSYFSFSTHFLADRVAQQRMCLGSDAPLLGPTPPLGTIRGCHILQVQALHPTGTDTTPYRYRLHIPQVQAPHPTGTGTTPYRYRNHTLQVQAPHPTGTQAPPPTGTQAPPPTGTQGPPPTGTQAPHPTGTQAPHPTGTQAPHPTGTGNTP